MMSSCPTAVIETYLDGELPPERMLEVQAHVDGCEQCAEVVALERAMRQSLRRVTYDEAPVTGDLRARIQDALRRMEPPVVVRTPRQRRASVARRAREFVVYWGGPLAFAATLLLWLGSQSAKHEPAPVVPAPEAAQAVSASVSSDEILDRLLDYHSAPPVPEVTDTRLVPQLERDVGVRVRMPTLMNAEWQGASVVPVVRGLRAATLRYKLPDEHSVTIYVYDASRVPLRAALKERMIRQQPVYVGYRRGYSIAALERRGLGYAVATDQDDPASVKLVTSLH
jgi:mycothiol system anti-sigma-R factor